MNSATLCLHLSKTLSIQQGSSTLTCIFSDEARTQPPVKIEHHILSLDHNNDDMNSIIFMYLHFNHGIFAANPLKVIIDVQFTVQDIFFYLT